MTPLHLPQDPEKVATLAASMERDGWVGAPLVAYDLAERPDLRLLTGSHRYAAWTEVLGFSAMDIPVVDLGDIAAEVGVYPDAADWCPDPSESREEAIAWIMHSIPQDLRAKYGLHFG